LVLALRRERLCRSRFFLGFRDRPPPAVGEAQVTYIPIRGLPRPAPKVARGEVDHGERIGQQVLRLLNFFAGHLE